MSENNSTVLINALHTVTTEFERKMQEEQRIGKAIADKTNNFIRTVIILFAVFSVYLVTQAYSLGTDVKHLAGSMVEMYKHFGEMSKDMGEMTNSVVHMSKNVQTIPMMTSEMGGIVNSVSVMKKDVKTMSTDVFVMDKNLGKITHGVNSMAKHFIHLNDSVNHLRINVKQMSVPVRKIPFM